jgi:hypothetical protein
VRPSLIVAAVLMLPGTARAQSATLQVDRQLYADLPFAVQVVAEGFDESPQPEQPELVIAGCKVTALGVAPNVSTSISIVNGRRTQTREVTYVYRWRVDAPKPGSYQIPPVTIAQGSRRAASQQRTVRVGQIPTTTDMRVVLELPQRKVWVGETFAAHLDWYLRKEPRDRQLVVPLFDMEDTFRVSAAPAPAGSDTMTFAAGAGELELPYTQERTQIDGLDYVRVRFTAMVTPIKAGPLALAPARAVAQLEVGQGRDRYGFPAARLGLYQAADKERVLEVAALPLAGKPASYSNAVGSSFSIAVRADRTVVRVGDPIKLDITVRGDTRLDGLILPKLDAPGALDPTKFAVPTDAPVGRLTDDTGTTKEFQVTVQVQSLEARTIPPIPFAYFDPSAGAYRTVSSSEIALQVAGASVVGAGDVVGAPRPGTAKPGDLPADIGTAAALSLSSPAETLAGVTSVARIRPLLIILYVLPLLLLAASLWWTRGGARRQAHGALDAALAEVDAALDHAAARPARDAVGPLITALRNLSRLTSPPLTPSVAAGEAAGGVEGPKLFERLETESFAPGAAEKPLPEALRTEVRTAARTWVAAARDRERTRPRRTTTAALVLLAAGTATAALPRPAHAASPAPPERSAAAGGAESRDAALTEARTAYTEAMAATDRDVRVARFARASALFGELAAAEPDHPELLADWGNAAAGAGDLGTAVLAWRRALRLDPAHERARSNLSWARKQSPTWLPRPAGRGAVDTLFFWHERTTRAQRHLIAAIAFAFAVLLWLPWRIRRRTLLRRLSVLPAALWLALIVSLLVERDASRDAVVITDQVILRSADGTGAPAALSTPLPAGAEVTIREERPSWTRIALADGTTGWLPSSAVTRIAP